MKTGIYQSVVYKEGRHYVAQCLDVDISSFGKDKLRALANLKEALELYLEDSTQGPSAKVESPTIHILDLQHA